MRTEAIGPDREVIVFFGKWADPQRVVVVYGLPIDAEDLATSGGVIDAVDAEIVDDDPDRDLPHD